jgi:hypothetical protein
VIDRLKKPVYFCWGGAAGAGTVQVLLRVASGTAVVGTGAGAANGVVCAVVWSFGRVLAGFDG